MDENELISIWKSQDQKLNEVLSLNKAIMTGLTRDRLHNTSRSIQTPMRAALLIGIPYTIFLYFITFIAINAGAVFIALAFGVISLIMTVIIIGNCYHLVLLNQINRSGDVLEVQEKVAMLKLSSFNLTRLAILQLPFWSMCWISLEALMEAPLIYGGVNLLIFLVLASIAYWLFKQLSLKNTNSPVKRFFLSGKEWEPIEKSLAILEQLEGIKTNEPSN